MNIFITIHKATNLMAKDRNLLGKRTSSDPYVKVLYMEEEIGKTPVKKKTLYPEWNHILQHLVGSKDEDIIMSAITPVSLNRPNHPYILLVCYDHDFALKDDILGVVAIPIPFKGIDKQWFPLQSRSPENPKFHCSKAQGKILVSIQIASTKVPPTVRRTTSGGNPFTSGEFDESDDESDVNLGFKRRVSATKSDSNHFSSSSTAETVLTNESSDGQDGAKPTRAEIDVCITIHKAINLLAKDRNLLGKHTTSDPYVKVFYMGEMVAKTFFKKKTLSPVWNQSFDNTIGEDEADVIRKATAPNSWNNPDHPSFLLVLYDHDIGSSDDILGQVVVPISYRGVDKEWFTLESGDPDSKYFCKKSQGQCQVSVKITDDPLAHTVGKKKSVEKSEYSSDDDSDDSDSEDDDMCKSKASGGEPNVILTIHRANGLAAMDCNVIGRSTSSDPYVKIFYKGQNIGKTPTKKRSLCPEWEHSLKHFVGEASGEMIMKAQDPYSLNRPNHPAFLLVMYDHDNGSADDIMGQITIPIPPKGIDQKWYTLTTGEPKTKYHCKKTQGEIQVSIAFDPGFLKKKDDNDNPFADSDSEVLEDEISDDDSDGGDADEECSLEGRDDEVGLKATVTLHKATGLAAMDCNIVGKHTSTDPYAKVFLTGDVIGKTPVKKKELSPVWEHPLDPHFFGAEESKMILKARSSKCMSAPNYPKLLCVVYDHDNGKADDIMGQITIPVSRKGFDKEWYDLETGDTDSKYHCKSTQGRVQVSLKIDSASLDDIEKAKERKSSKVPFSRASTLSRRKSSDISDEPKTEFKTGETADVESGEDMFEENIDSSLPSSLNITLDEKSRYHPGLASRQIMILVFVVVTVTTVILVIGFTVISGGGYDIRDAATASETPGVRGAINLSSPTELQLLLETAEKVVVACSPSQLNVDMSACFVLCHTKMCCFGDKTDPYNCEDDASKLCGVYSGCEALMKGMALKKEAADEN